MGELELCAALRSELSPLRQEIVALRREVKRLTGQGHAGAMNTTEAAAFLGMSRWTFNKICRKGEIKFKARGKRKKIIPRSELERWLKENLVSSQDGLRASLDGRRR